MRPPQAVVRNAKISKWQSNLYTWHRSTKMSRFDFILLQCEEDVERERERIEDNNSTNWHCSNGTAVSTSFYGCREKINGITIIARLFCNRFAREIKNHFRFHLSSCVIMVAIRAIICFYRHSPEALSSYQVVTNLILQKYRPKRLLSSVL